MADGDAKDPLSRYLEAAMGLTDLTRRRAEQVIRGLIQQGDAADNPKELVENLLERSQENRDALVMLVRGETRRAMKAMGLATTNDVERLEQQLRAVRRQLADTEERVASQAEGRADPAADDQDAGATSPGGAVDEAGGAAPAEKGPAKKQTSAKKSSAKNRSS